MHLEGKTGCHQVLQIGPINCTNKLTNGEGNFNNDLRHGLIRYKRILLLPWVVQLFSSGLFSKTMTTASFGLFSKQTHQREPFTKRQTTVTQQHITPEDTTKLPKSIPFHTLKGYCQYNGQVQHHVYIPRHLFATQDTPQLLSSLKYLIRKVEKKKNKRQKSQILVPIISYTIRKATRATYILG